MSGGVRDLAVIVMSITACRDQPPSSAPAPVGRISSETDILSLFATCKLSLPSGDDARGRGEIGDFAILGQGVLRELECSIDPCHRRPDVISAIS